MGCRAASLPLQRVLVDFGADQAFGRVPDKLREHYGIAMPVSTIRLTAERHAQCLFEHEMAREIHAEPAKGLTFIGEMDGPMAPVVEVAQDGGDKRKGKALAWKEARLCIAHALGSVTPVFGGHFAGGVEESGRQWGRCAVKASFGPGSHLHAVGDGALWIANQVGARFGKQGTCLVDFSHACEYLGAAASACAANDAGAWMETQKGGLKANQSGAVLEAPAPHLEAGYEGPVADCDRYLRNRLSQLDYQGALAKGSPIGSGEIESAHRYVIQERLKLPGAWWTPSNVEAMLALRLSRANREYDDYWRSIEKQAA